MTTATKSQPEVQTREQWLEHRRQGIGASDVPVILGVSRFKSPYTLWAEKSGLIPLPDETIPMRVGHALEPLISELYEEKTGRKVYDPGACTIFRHPVLKFFFCTPDRIEIETSSPVELKTAGEFRAKDWKDDDPPLDHVCQLQTQIAILGSDGGSLAGLVGNREFHWFDVPRHDRLVEHIVHKVDEFWNRILEGDAPPIDGTASTAHTLKVMHPKDSGEERLLLELEADAIAYGELGEKIKAFEAERDTAKNRIIAAIGDASYGVFGSVKYSYKHQTRAGQIVVPEHALARLVEHKIPYERKGATEFRMLRKCK